MPTEMTNWTALCAECKGCGVHSSTDELGGVSTNSFCPDCAGSGYQHPWVAPLLAGCPFPIGSPARKANPGMHDWHDDTAYRCPYCTGTGKRYPQLWRQEESEGRGSGWIPEITEGALWMVGAIYGDEFTVSLCIEAGFTERGFYARPARDYEFVDAWLKRTEDQRIEALGKAIAAVGVVESPHG